MRKTPLILVVVGFALWFAWKGKPYLDSARPQVFSTPTVQPTGPGDLGNVAVKRHGRVCIDQLDFGPGARYAVVTAITDQPTGRLRFEARAPGYAADAVAPPGTGSNQQIVVPLKPAARDVRGGTLCITNEGQHKVGFYGVSAGGRQGTAPQTKIDGSLSDLDLSLTLLTSPSKTLGSRLGTTFDHMAAFNPMSGWSVWVVALLALIGVPVAVGVALGRALAQDDEAPGGS
ncbi:MAG TPA: hypothetical protein VK501_21245 [Baekduia sp.]|uniref:hypothetical protein n=1 Tax=Baekduia sp. TaxID=2600305 RepID=UPI002B75D77F|nr:hypothetical protein [Baekduia sp.]HMJ36443.1 hypothetical protein [Baekduia sp.]